MEKKTTSAVRGAGAPTHGVRKTVSSAALAAPAASARAAKVLRTTWRAAFALRARFIDLQIAPANFFPIQAGHGLRRFRVIGHFDESKTACPPGLPVHGQVNARYLAERRKQLAQFALRGLEAHVAHK